MYKIVAEHINEKFTQDTDPIDDLGIGLKGIFNNLKEGDIFRIKKDLPKIDKKAGSYIKIKSVTRRCTSLAPYTTCINYIFYKNKEELLDDHVYYSSSWYINFDFFKQYFEPVNKNDLRESMDKRKDLEQKTTYITDNKNFGLQKKLIGVVKDSGNNDVKICLVNGSYITAKDPGLGFKEFIQGGHHYVTSYPGYRKNIPEDEIWVDKVYVSEPAVLKGIMKHEFLERNLMKYKKWSYDKAHEYANKKEEEYRQRAKS